MKACKGDRLLLKTAVILAAGKLKNLDEPACLLPIMPESNLLSMVNVLESLNFKKIVIVTGYKGDKVRLNLKNHANLVWVHNEDYLYTGTMHSLSLTAQYVNEDFLLLEGDLVVPSHMIEAIINNESSIVTATSNLTGSGDEAFVETDSSSSLIGLSKDIRQLNEINTEMIGITKISKLLFDDMISKYSYTNNPWINYEYLMYQLRDIHPIRCLNFVNTPWCDIDDYESYVRALEIVIPAIKIFDKNIEIVKEKFNSVVKESIDCIALVGGMTNDNYKIQTFKNVYFVRLPGVGTDSMIVRENEPYNVRQIQKLDIDAPNILLDSINGFKITEFIPNSVTFSERTARLPQHLKMVANLLRKLHESEVKFKNKFDFIENLRNYMSYLKNPITYKNYDQIYELLHILVNRLNSDFTYCEAPCHNDLVPENFLLNEKNKLFLIDWEYSGQNDLYWDLASYLLECNASDKETKNFLNYYFNHEPTDEDIIKIKFMKAFQDILWSIWALVKKEKGDDEFEEYGIKRYERGVKTVKELLNYV